MEPKWRVTSGFRLHLKKRGRELWKGEYPLVQLWFLPTARFLVKVTTCGFKKAVLHFMCETYIGLVDMEELMQKS